MEEEVTGMTIPRQPEDFKTVELAETDPLAADNLFFGAPKPDELDTRQGITPTPDHEGEAIESETGEEVTEEKRREKTAASRAAIDRRAKEIEADLPAHSRNLRRYIARCQAAMELGVSKEELHESFYGGREISDPIRLAALGYEAVARWLQEATQEKTLTEEANGELGEMEPFRGDLESEHSTLQDPTVGGGNGRTAAKHPDRPQKHRFLKEQDDDEALEESADGAVLIDGGLRINKGKNQKTSTIHGHDVSQYDWLDEVLNKQADVTPPVQNGQPTQMLKPGDKVEQNGQTGEITEANPDGSTKVQFQPGSGPATETQLSPDAESSGQIKRAGQRTMPQVGEHWDSAAGSKNGVTIVSVTPDEECVGGYDVEIAYDNGGEEKPFHKDLATFWSRFTPLGKSKQAAETQVECRICGGKLDHGTNSGLCRECYVLNEKDKKQAAKKPSEWTDEDQVACDSLYDGVAGTLIDNGPNSGPVWDLLTELNPAIAEEVFQNTDGHEMDEEVAALLEAFKDIGGTQQLKDLLDKQLLPEKQAAKKPSEWTDEDEAALEKQNDEDDEARAKKLYKKNPLEGHRVKVIYPAFGDEDFVVPAIGTEGTVTKYDWDSGMVTVKWDDGSVGDIGYGYLKVLDRDKQAANLMGGQRAPNGMQTDPDTGAIEQSDALEGTEPPKGKVREK